MLPYISYDLYKSNYAFLEKKFLLPNFILEYFTTVKIQSETLI